MKRRIHGWLTLAALAPVACSTVNTNTTRPSMLDTASQQNTTTIHKLYEDCFNRGNFDLLDELVSPDYAGPQGGKGPQAFKGIVVGLHNAFPDIHYTVEDVTAEDDRVAIRWHWSGTHRGAFRSFAPSQKAVSNSGMAIFHLRNGKIAAATLETDRLGFLQQIGAVPPDGVLLAPRAQPAVDEKR